MQKKCVLSDFDSEIKQKFKILGLRVASTLCNNQHKISLDEETDASSVLFSEKETEVSKPAEVETRSDVKAAMKTGPSRGSILIKYFRVEIVHLF